MEEGAGANATARETASQAVPHLLGTLGDAHQDTRRAQEYSQAAAMGFSSQGADFLDRSAGAPVSAVSRS